MSIQDKREKALGNIYISARQALAYGHRGTTTVSQERMIERKEELLRHIIRFCEEAGEKSSLLRSSLPTELTEGESG